jgi:hypothetical protein
MESRVENLLSTFEGTCDSAGLIASGRNDAYNFTFLLLDACKTYELTLAIRKAGEETHAKRASK